MEIGNNPLNDPNYIGSISTWLAERGRDDVGFYFFHHEKDGYFRHSILYNGTFVLEIEIVDGKFREISYKKGPWEEKLRDFASQFSELEQIAARPKILASCAGQLTLPGFQLPAANLAN